MRTIQKNVYKFAELSEKAQEKAIEDYSENNLDYDWWLSIYEDAERIGLKITSFELDRRRNAKGRFIESAYDSANLIVKEHGEKCDTYIFASRFISDYDSLVEKYSDGINTDSVIYENEYEFDKELDELEKEFLNSILEEYSLMLHRENKHLRSEEHIIEMIECNEYEFYENGEMI